MSFTLAGDIDLSTIESCDNWREGFHVIFPDGDIRDAMKFTASFKLVTNSLNRSEEGMWVFAHLVFGHAEHLGELTKHRSRIIYDECKVGADFDFQFIESITSTFLNPADFLLGFNLDGNCC